MRFIKKSFKVLKENFLILFGIEAIFFLLAYFFISFLISKIIFYFEIVNSLMPELEVMRENLTSNIDLVQFNNFMALIGEGIRSILIMAALLIFGFYLLWCFFQSTSWKLCYVVVKKKLRLKNLFKDFSFSYFLKFSLLSLIVFVLILPFLFQIITRLKGFLLNNLISRFNLSESFFSVGPTEGLIVPILVLLFLIYFIILIYVLLNENTFFKAVKNAFLIGVKKFYLFFVFLLFLGIFIFSLFLIRINLFLSLGVILILFVYFKILMNIFVRE